MAHVTTFNRRTFLKSAGAAAATAALAGSASAALSPAAQAQQRRVLGTVVDYSAGVPSASAVKAAGHMGAVQQSTQNLEVVKVDVERGLIAVRGAVPGAAGGDVIVRPASKA